MVVISHTFSHGKFDSYAIGGKYTGRIIGTWGGLGVSIFFLLSGYGCWHSLRKLDSVKDKIIWLAQHVAKLLLYYLITFTTATLIRKFVYGVEDDVMADFIRLCIPGTTTWYIKIQILMYAFLVVSSLLPWRNTEGLFGMAVAYAVIAYFCGLTEFWWKTALCFPTGAVIAENKGVMELWLFNEKRKIAALSGIALACLFWIALDKIILPAHLIAYVGFSVCVTLLACLLDYRSFAFEKLGRYSLSIYLSHIGIVCIPSIVWDIRGALTFIAIICVLSVITEKLAAKLWALAPKNKLSAGAA